jgi:tetratricopeptide (TPR) repeat protein
LAGVLQRSPDPDKRLSAVLATLRLQNKDAIALLRLALRDSEDDVRLLAYALLDRKEQAISERIMFSLGQLQNAPSDKEHFKLHQAIAYDCWELIYSGLAQGEVSTYWLDTACKHAEAALKLNPYHAGLRFLYGIILLRQAKLDKARTAFIRAEKLGIASNKVAPYLAEISFLKKRFCEVRHHLVSNDSAAFQQPLTVLAS